MSVPPITVTTVVSDPAAPALPGSAGAAYQLAWLQQPQATGNFADTPFTPQPEVAIEDKTGDIVSSDFSSVTLSIMSAPAGGSISNTCSGVDAYGIVQFSDCSVNLAGSYQIQAVDPGLLPTSGTSFTVGANPALWLPSPRPPSRELLRRAPPRARSRSRFKTASETRSPQRSQKQST